MKNRFINLIGLIIGVGVVHSALYGCTEFRVIAQDKTVVVGRSLEWGEALKSHLVIQPRGIERQSKAPHNDQGLRWTSKYGIIYINGYGLDKAVDGMNEKGLSVGVLYFPGFAEFQKITSNHNKQALSHTLFAFWLLDNFATVNEIKKALPDIYVWGEPVDLPSEKNVIFPLHFGVHDATGKGIVIEYTKDGLKIFDNELGVLTNSPTYDWHLTNLRNYIGLTSLPPKSITLNSSTMASIGVGTGLFGLPGDPTPPSRFVRTATILRLVDPAIDKQEAVNLTNHILNSVDIIRGIAQKEFGTRLVKDYTQWVLIKDLTHKELYFRTYTNSTLRKIDLTKLNFDSKAKKMSIDLEDNTPVYIDITDMLNKYK